MIKYLNQFGGDSVVVSGKQTTKPQRNVDGTELINVKTLDPNYDLRYNQHGFTYGIDTNHIKDELSKTRP